MIFQEFVIFGDLLPDAPGGVTLDFLRKNEFLFKDDIKDQRCTLN
jgi:hypothetical protein